LFYSTFINKLLFSRSRRDISVATSDPDFQWPLTGL